VAVIAMHCQGLDKWSTASFLEILLGMRYQIRTALGISENDFSNLHDTLLGVLQGVGWSTTTWLLISVILLCCIEKRSPGINIINPHKLSISSVQQRHSQMTQISGWYSKPRLTRHART